MVSSREEDLFLSFRRSPGPQSLAALLQGHQDHIYNIAFQVLRHPEDAEDATQEILIEVAAGIPSIDDPRLFKAWLYRVALHSALDLKEARSRRVELARRLATLASTVGGDMDSEDRAALLRAIGDLDDRTRCILLEHYFDKLTLEEIGAREGVSSVAIWKRLDRAKERLRRSLAGVAVAPLLEGLSPVAAPAGFVAKAAIAGGVVVGTKSAVSAGTIVAALLLVGAASTGGYFVGSSRASVKIKESPSIATGAPRAEAPATVAETSPEPEVRPATVVGGGPVEESPRKGKPAGATLPDRGPFNIGRPLKAKFEELRKVETWDDFYKKVNEEKSLSSSQFEDLLFLRVDKELGLDAATAQNVRTLWDAEREESTRAIIDNAGGSAKFSMLTDEGFQFSSHKPEWIRLREQVRRTHDLDYLKLLTYDQLQIFNQHLRNSEISFEATYGSEGTHFLVTGVGRPLK